MRIAEENWEDLEVIWNYLRVESGVPDRADAAIVGGSGKMIDGAERATELYKKGIVDLIVVSGYSGFENSILGGRTEAEVLAEVLIENGVPEMAILREPRATNTGENIIFSEKLLRERGIEGKSVILVHEPYMTRRFLATALAAWPEPQPKLFVTSKDISMRGYYEHDMQAYGGDGLMISLMLGDYERIKSYPSLGFSVVQPVSEQAEQAYVRLETAGFVGKPI
jgi:uncharacterized SAM-binding protein YcdF (DUF218 family)